MNLLSCGRRRLSTTASHYSPPPHTTLYPRRQLQAPNIQGTQQATTASKHTNSLTVSGQGQPSTTERDPFHTSSGSCISPKHQIQTLGREYSNQIQTPGVVGEMGPPLDDPALPDLSLVPLGAGILRERALLPP